MSAGADPADLAARILGGDRRALARAVTLLESLRPEDRAAANAVLAGLPARTGLRIGLTGTPGVGKSTFIEAFGTMLTGQGLRVAVLAVDPSSSVSGGSILGDKTRMERLSRDPLAFVRPSPSQREAGGVARRTREVATLCERAGFDVVLIEPVGVGQSEVAVAGMTDIFVLLVAPAGGDELQGVKRGIMEMADLLLVTKADGDLKAAAQRTLSDYAGALRLFRARPGDPEGTPSARALSSITGEGVAEAWAAMQALIASRRTSGAYERRRAVQASEAFEAEVRRGLIDRLTADEGTRTSMARLGGLVAAGELSPDAAAAEFLSGIGLGPSDGRL